MMLAPAESASLGWDVSYTATHAAHEVNLVSCLAGTENRALFSKMLLFTVQ